MTSEEFTSVVVKAIVGKVPEKIYNDVFSPVLKKMGIVLGYFGDVAVTASNTITFPLREVNEEINFITEKRKLIRLKNFEKFAQELNKIPEEKTIPIHTEISIPILDRFSYISNNELSNAFVNLLTKASSTETINMAHPGFINIIDRLSPDEAKLLKFIYDNNLLLQVSGKHTTSGYQSGDLTKTDDPMRFDYQYNNFNYENFSFEKDIYLIENANLHFKLNLEMYLDNLKSLGLINQIENLSDSEKEYVNIAVDKIKESYKPEQYIEKNRRVGNVNMVYNQNFPTRYDIFKLSKYGVAFSNACLK
jgi:hypothetical protein